MANETSSASAAVMRLGGGRVGHRQCAYRAGRIVMFRYSMAPWSPCSMMGPGDPSSLSIAPPVMPGISRSVMTRRPLNSTVTMRPTSVISNVCHSPG